MSAREIRRRHRWGTLAAVLLVGAASMLASEAQSQGQQAPSASGAGQTAPGQGSPAAPPAAIPGLPGIMIEPHGFGGPPRGSGDGADGAAPACPLIDKRKLELIV